jgi:isopenicillin-N N-acyltransferase-like protein
MDDSLPLIEMTGTPFERGRIYGNAARRQIADACAHYSRSWSFSSDQLKARVLRFLPELEAFDLSLVEEVRGIASGSGREFEEILAINARNELLFAPAEDPDPEGCSIIAATQPATRPGFVYMAQNWDWSGALRDSAVLLRIRGDSEPAKLLFVDAGRIGMHGLNEAGLGICGNYIETRVHPPVSGVPIPFLRRRILSCGSVAEAEQLVRQTRRSMSSNYLLADVSGAVRNLEATPQVVLASDPVDGVIAHTNHFCHPNAPGEDAGLERVPDSAPRLSRIRALLASAAGEGVDPVVLKRILSDHDGHPASICRHGDSGPGWHTLGSHVMDLKNRTIEVAFGNPCETPYRKASL